MLHFQSPYYERERRKRRSSSCNFVVSNNLENNLNHVGDISIRRLITFEGLFRHCCGIYLPRSFSSAQRCRITFLKVVEEVQSFMGL